MKPFFDSEERTTQLWHAAKAWEGTPYFANQASRGYAVGCVNLIHELFVECAAVPRMELPVYQSDYAHHSTQTQLLRFLLDAPALAGRLMFVPFHARRMPGDLYGVRSGRLDHHLAAFVGFGKIVQAVEEHGVIVTEAEDERFSKRVLYVLRLMEDRA